MKIGMTHTLMLVMGCMDLSAISSFVKGKAVGIDLHALFYLNAAHLSIVGSSILTFLCLLLIKY